MLIRFSNSDLLPKSSKARRSFIDSWAARFLA